MPLSILTARLLLLFLIFSQTTSYIFRLSYSNVRTLNGQIYSVKTSPSPTHDLFTTFTFYKFAEKGISDPEAIVEKTKRVLQDVDVKGTLIFAKEGINAQITIRQHDINKFRDALSQVDSFLQHLTFNIGETKYVDLNSEKLPFKRLIVRTKQEILTDGIDDPIDWTQAGPELDSNIWHQEIQYAQSSIDTITNNAHNNSVISNYNDNNNNNNTIDNEDNKKVILLDCRNTYESEMGTFQHAIPLNTTKFSDSWEILEDILKDVPKNTRILTFCTGGIRCVKVNAYLRQKMGFENTARLKNGIVAYENWINSVNDDINTDLNDTNYINELNSSDGDNITIKNNKVNKVIEYTETIQSTKTVTSVTNSVMNNEKSDNGNDNQTRESNIKSLFIGKNFVFDRRRMRPGEYPS